LRCGNLVNAAADGTQHEESLQKHTDILEALGERTTTLGHFVNWSKPQIQDYQERRNVYNKALTKIASERLLTPDSSAVQDPFWNEILEEL
jgi:hypothetical protein